MKSILLGNFLTQPNQDFPVDAELLDSMQSNTLLTAVLGNIAGDRVVILGCELEQNDTRRKEGYVFLRTTDYPEGEILYFSGGLTSSGMYLKKATVAVSAHGYTYPQAYTERSLAPGLGSENYSWDDFTDIRTIKQLQVHSDEQDATIAAIQPTPLGVVQLWAGAVSADALPENYLFCDGAQLPTTSYPELYAVIGRLHTPTGTPSGYFNLPDLRGQFVVGYNGTDADYDTVAKKGGEKAHILTEGELATHSHSFNDYYHIEGLKGGISGDDTVGQRVGSKGHDYDNIYLWYKTHDTSPAGSGEAHENRPPYYTMAYIIKVK